MTSRPSAAAHQFAYPVVRPVPRRPAAALGSLSTW
jgi:hypothetical protein